MIMKAKQYIKKTSYREDKRVSKNPNIYYIDDMINFAEEYHQAKVKENERLHSVVKRFLITATICNRRVYFCIEAVSSDEAIKIFNLTYPNTKFRNFKELVEIKRNAF